MASNGEFNLKNIKNNFVSNSKNENSINSNSNNFISDDDKKLHDEVKYISNALNEGSLNLTPEEESKLKSDLDLILSNLEKQNQSNNNSEKMPEDKNININESKEFDSDDSIFVNDGDADVYSSSFEDNFLLEPDEVVSMDDTNDSVFKNNNSQNLVNIDAKEFIESDGIIVDDVVESVDSEGIVVDDMDETMSVDDALNDLMDDYSNDVVIKVNNVSMEYKLSQDKIDTLKEFFIRTIKRNKGKTKTITALKNISFEIPKGDRVGIIGFNGAGKSTLLKLLSRVYDPTEGTIETKGKIAPLLELGAGFDNNYSGKANVFLNGAFLGYSEDFIKEKYDEIVEFSELGDAINYHVKTYSSGMRAKLGFSIATIVEPDILIIDEILSVGDIKFRRKSSDKIRSLINSGITVLLVSHSVDQIRELCNKAIWIDNGELKMMGEVNKVCDAYVKAAEEASDEQLKNIELN